jgi:hypothetical protein
MEHTMQQRPFTFGFKPFAKILTALSFATLSLTQALPASAAITYLTWPGSSSVTTVDASNSFGGNLSGLFYQPASGSQTPVLWAVQNSPSKMYNLVWNGSSFVKNSANNWSSGKTLRYPNGTGAPDAEGVTRAELTSSMIYVATERDGSGSNRFSILSYDTNASGTSINASNEWNLTANLPAVSDSNLGLEAITWVPDSYLTARQFKDENTNLPYDPANYPNHGTGLFLVGLEANGQIYAYALNLSGSSFTRVATIASGHSKIMGLSFDRDNGVLWAYCDNNCSNRSHLLAVDSTVGSPTHGKFIIKKSFNRPGGMSNMNNEGIAIAPETECVSGKKSFFWADDGQTNGYSLRKGNIPCGPLF